MKALDLSFGAAAVTPEWCAARIAEGYRLLIADAWLGAQSPLGVQDALRMWREAGDAWWASLTPAERVGEVHPTQAAYYVPHAFRPAAYHLDKAQAAIGAEWEHLRFLALDVEDIDPQLHRYPPEQQWKVDHLRASADLVRERGRRPIIYSGPGAWAWSQLPPSFTDLPLWKATYGRDGQPAPVDLGASFGGWTQAVGHQFQDTTDVDGVACDLSEFDTWWVEVGDPADAPGVDSGPVAAVSYPNVPAEVWQTVGDVLCGWGEKVRAEGRLSDADTGQMLAELDGVRQAVH